MWLYKRIDGSEMTKLEELKLALAANGIPFDFYESSECIIWTGGVSSTGYGTVRHKNKTKRVHRLIFEIINGPLMAHEHVHHIKPPCTSKRCINPSHLAKTTAKEHPDTTGAINRAKTHCVHGHEFSEINTRIYKNVFGYIRRICRECERDSNENRRIKKSA